MLLPFVAATVAASAAGKCHATALSCINGIFAKKFSDTRIDSARKNSNQHKVNEKNNKPKHNDLEYVHFDRHQALRFYDEEMLESSEGS